jgi:hypothetical protein
MNVQNAALIIALLSAISGCRQERAAEPRPSGREASKVLGSDCPTTFSASADWLEIVAKAAPVAFRLPPGSEELAVPVPDGQNWRLPGGSFAYRISQRTATSDTVGRPQPWCTVPIDGRRSLVRYYYGDAAFGRRAYLTAELPVKRNSILELIASSYDSAGTDTLLAVMRSLRVHGQP